MLRCVAMLGLLAGGAGAWAAEPVKICLGGGNEWPPFTYWERHDGKPDQSRLTGSAATLVLTALKHLGYDYDVSYLPWARVQQELADYASRQNCEVTWDASYTPSERPSPTTASRSTTPASGCSIPPPAFPHRRTSRRRVPWPTSGCAA